MKLDHNSEIQSLVGTLGVESLGISSLVIKVFLIYPIVDDFGVTSHYFRPILWRQTHKFHQVSTGCRD
ncbi:MAG: hypothetical protein HC916_19445 [Coleofasciculaceae cyanobacterium SM2_1_6]|nr:hypothetical protein [Coleofasciculaceae cyanobacterium SM2_1_6]